MAPSRKSAGADAEKKKKKKSTEVTKTVATKRKEKTKTKGGRINGVLNDLVVPSSSTESQTLKEDEKKGAKPTNQRTTPSKPKAKPKTKKDAKPNSNPKPKSKARSKPKGGKEDEDEEGSSVCAFPMNRIKVIIRSGEAADSRITQEAIFLINKASEKFIENMCEDSFISDKNYFGYKHIYHHS